MPKKEENERIFYMKMYLKIVRFLLDLEICDYKAVWVIAKS